MSAMRMKFVRNGRTKRRELLIATQHGEAIDRKRATWLVDAGEQLLLGFSFEASSAGIGGMMHFDVEGLWSLKTFLAKRMLVQQELMGLLEALLALIDLCAARRIPTELGLYDPEYIFVDAQCCPHFVVLPLEEVPLQDRNSPLALLRALGDADHLRFDSPNAEELSRRLGKYLINQGEVFSANRFRTFMETEERQSETGAAGKADIPEEPGTSSWASAGGGAPVQEAKGSTLFWSPLAGMVEEEEPAPAPKPQPAPKVAVTPAPAQQPVPAPASQPAQEPAPASVPIPQPTPKPAPVPQPIPASQLTVAPAPQPAPASVLDAIPDPIVVLPPRHEPPKSHAWLIRPGTGEQYELPLNREVLLGRGSMCDIRLLGNSRLSRMHAKLLFDGTTVRVSDLAAVNGIFVGGVRLQQHMSVALRSGQTLRLANEEVTIRIE